MDRIEKLNPGINAYINVNKGGAGANAAAAANFATGANTATTAATAATASANVVTAATAAATAADSCSDATVVSAAAIASDAIARAQAAIDAGCQKPLTGIPIGVSDNICTRDMPTTCGSRMLDGYRPPYDAAIVEKMLAQDAVILGKLNLDEFSMGCTTESSYSGRTLNPYDGSRSPGGACGGAAAAVASGLCAASVGVDSDGSVRLPAAFCGVTGFRPTYGLVSRYGCVAYASSFDQSGPLAASAADCAYLLNVISGQCDRDVTTLMSKKAKITRPKQTGIKGLRIGLIRELLGDHTSPEIRDAVYAAAKWYEDAGAIVSEVGIPMLKYGVSTINIIACAEASSNLARFDGVRYGHRAAGASDYYDMVAKSRGEGLGIEVKRRILFGTHVLSGENMKKYYLRAIAVANDIKKQYFDVLAECDALISPAALRLPPVLGTPQLPVLPDICQVGAALAGLPCVTTPCGYAESGNDPLPIGFMITCNRFADYLALSLAEAFESGFVRRAPSMAGDWKGFIE